LETLALGICYGTASVVSDMITIDGLNKKQVAMLDKLWSLETEKDLHNYVSTLDSQDTHMAQTLVEMIILEAIDTDIANKTDFPEVKDILEKIMNKG